MNLTIIIDDSNDRDTARTAENLHSSLRSNGIIAERVAAKGAQDLGATISLVVTSAVVATLVKCIFDSINKRSNSRLVIVFEDGSSIDIPNFRASEMQKYVDIIKSKSEDA